MADEAGGTGSQLSAAEEALVRAGSATRTTETRVGTLVQDMKRQRFRSIAAQLSRVQEALTSSLPRQEDLAEQVRAARKRADGVTDSMSPQGVIDALSPLVAELTSASTGTFGIMQELNKARQLVQAALKGGVPGPLVGEITTIIRALGQANTRLKAAKESTEKKIAEARRTGTLPSANSLPSKLSPLQEDDARTGTPEPAPSERPGERVAQAEHTDDSSLEEYRGEIIRKAPKVKDSVQNVVNITKIGLNRPTGQHVGAAPGVQLGGASTPVPAADLVTGVVAGAAMIGEITRQIKRRVRKRRESDADQ